MDIIVQIEAGIHDKDLVAMQHAVSARLASLRGGMTISDFGIGDRIIFNSLCGTRYLIGETGQVVGKRRTKVVVKLDKPTGRFVRNTSEGPVSADITVPTAIIDRV